MNTVDCSCWWKGILWKYLISLQTSDFCYITYTHMDVSCLECSPGQNIFLSSFCSAASLSCITSSISFLTRVSWKRHLLISLICLSKINAFVKCLGLTTRYDWYENLFGVGHNSALTWSWWFPESSPVILSPPLSLFHAHTISAV